MKLFALAAALLFLGLCAYVFLNSKAPADPSSATSPTAGMRADAPAVIDAPAAPEAKLAADTLAAPAGVESQRAGIETPAAVDAHVVITGRVQLDSGCDDERIEVFAMADEASLDELEGQTERHSDQENKVVGTMLGRAAVDRDMSFHLSLPEGTAKAYLLVRGRYAYTNESTRVSTKDARPIVLVASCGCAIVGSVSPPAGVDAASTDIEGLTVDVSMSLEGTGDLAGMDRAKRTARVHEGKFEVGALDPRTGYDVAFSPAKLAATSVAVGDLVAGRTRTVDVVLPRGGTLRGVVKGPAGAPVADAQVLAKRKGHLFGIDDQVVRAATTGKDGAFELLAVQPGHVLLSASAAGYLSDKVVPVDLADVGVQSGIVLELSSGTSIRGSVTWKDGKPAAGAIVDVTFDKSHMAGMDAFNARRGGKGQARSDDQGRFVVSGLGAGPFTVRARSGSADKASTTADKDAPADDEQTARKDGVKPGTKDLVLVLAPPEGVRGHVVDAQATPVTKFHMHAASVGSGMLANVGQDEADLDVNDESGAFLVALAHAGKWKLSVRSSGFAESEPLEVQLPLKPDAAPIVITLQRAAVVHGLVQDPRGAPVVGATISTTTGQPNWKRMMSGTEAPSAKSGDGGAFTLEGLPAGHMSLVAESPGWARSLEMPVDLVAGQTLEGVVLVMRDGGKLTGEIYEGGKPASGMLVQATLLKSYDQKAGMSDARGRFELAHLDPGSYQVVAMPTSALAGKEDGSGVDTAAMMSKLKMTSAQITDGQETHVVLGAPPQDPVQVHGRVTHAGGGFAGATVMFIAHGKDVLANLKSATSGSDGSYAVTLDGPGSYGVSVQRMSGGPMNQSSVEFTAKVPAEKDYELDLAMPTARISGVVRDEDGAPAAGVSVQIAADDGVKTGTLFGGQYHITSTDNDGRYDIDVLRAGKYTVSAGGDPLGAAMGGEAQHARQAQTVRLDEGQWQKDVDFKLEKPGTVVVTVVDERGDPVAGANVFARDPEGRPVAVMSTVTTDAGGTAKYSGLAHGRHTFSARTKDHTSSESAPIDVETGSEKSVKLALVAGTRLRIRVVDKDNNPLQAALSVTDEAGHEVASMISLSDIQEYMTGGGTRDEMRVGPVSPGKYRVRAVRADGKTEEKSVSVNGQAEREVKLRFED